MIHDWHVVRLLGRGDFASVNLVERRGSKAAMKVAAAATGSPSERLLVEVQALNELNHPHIPGLLEDGTTAEIPYFVMTLAPGSSLLSIVNDGAKQGRVLGFIESLKYVCDILSALAHMHSKELVHRDIKDANVIIDQERREAHLIDLGFCKRAGTSALRDKDSFWRAGAARFAPPGKLEDPALAAATHDVFAVGVLGYRMLTGLYPWSVPSNAGLRAYRDMVRKRPVVPVHELNSLIPVEVSQLIIQMLQLNDDQRISTAEALSTAQELHESLLSRDQPSTPVTNVTLLNHIVRDPLRGDIRLSTEEYRVLNSKELQRLRWVRQLGLTNLVYPGAEHSRLSHSIGTLERSERMLASLEAANGAKIDAELRQEVRLYALVHDYSHIAMGHSLEDQLGIFERHDSNHARYERLLLSDESELGGMLASSEIGRRVLARLDPSIDTPDDAIEHFVSGFMGADVLDYLDRDAYYCGLDHRVDSAVFRQMRLYAQADRQLRKVVSRTTGKFGLRADRDYAIETIQTERYAMFMKVYSHRTKLAADALLGKLLFEATSTGRARLTEAEVEWLGDDSLIYRCESIKKQSTAEYATRLRFRQLPGAVFRSRVIQEDEHLDARSYRDQQAYAAEKGFSNPEGRARTEKELAKRSGLDSSRVFLYSPATAPGYKLAKLWEQSSSIARPASSTPKSAAEMARRHLELWSYWVFLTDGSEREKRMLSEAAEDMFNRPNAIEEYRRTLL